MVLRPVYDPTPDMAAYPQQGPRPVSPYENSGQQPSAPQWQGYPPGRTSPYPPHHAPYGPPSPSGQFYGTPHGSPQPPPSAHRSGSYPPQPQYAGHSPEQYPPSGPGYSSQQGQNPYHHPQQHSSGPYPPSSPGYGGQQGQHPYYPPQQHSPYLPPSQPQYAQSPQSQHAQPGYQPQIKQEYGSSPAPGQLPQTEEERGLMGALAGGAAGGFAGHKVNHGFLGALGGAFAGHKLQDAYKDHKKQSRPSSRRSSSSSSSSCSSDDGKHGYKPQAQHAPPPPPPPAVHGTRGNFSQSSSRISLDNDHDLIAECGACDGSRKLSSISLNRLLTNDDGHFRWAREGNFAASARNVRLIHDGKFLQAELCRCDGSWRWDQICLDERIENSNGNLQMLW